VVDATGEWLGGAKGEYPIHRPYLPIAENECLSFQGWSLQFGGGSVRGTIIQCLRTFYDEGPGGGHHENMMGEYRTLGCAVHVAGGGVSIVQDFGR